MALYGNHPKPSRKTPASNDAVWHWFVCSGPHGEKFEWVDPVLGAGGKLRLLRKFISERVAAVPDFEEQARAIAIESLRSDDALLVLKGIHVLAAVGTVEEMLLIIAFANSENPDVAKHARTALFERGIKKKKK